MSDTGRIRFNQNGTAAQKNACIYYNNTNSGLILENLNTSGLAKGVKIISNFDIELDCFNEILLNKFSMSLFKVVSVIGTGDGGTYQVKNNTPIANFYINEVNNDVRIHLPNYLSGEEYMVDGINTYVRTANGKSCRVYGSSNTTLQRMYDIGSGNASPKDYVNIPANQNGHFIYYGNSWYYND